jgi:hypothetical protein
MDRTERAYRCFCGFKKVVSHICDKNEGFRHDKRRDDVDSAIKCAAFFSFGLMLHTIHWLWRLSSLAVRTVG